MNTDTFFSASIRGKLAGYLTILFLGVCVSPMQGAIYDVYSSSNSVTTSADQVSVSSSYYKTPSSIITNTAAIYANKDITWGSPGLSSGSTGSGVYTDLFRIQANNVEQGYNSNSSPYPYDQKSGVGIPVLQLSNASVVTYNGVTYFEFLFDGNEIDNAVSLDQLLFFTSPNLIGGNAGTNPTQAQVINYFENSTNQATLRYSLDSLDSSGAVTTDNAVLFYASGGSGHGDEGIYIPTSLIQGAAMTDYIYLYAKMGTTGTYNGVNFASSGGFEEFAYFRGDQGGTTYGSIVPESDGVLGGCLLIGFAMIRRRRAAASLHAH